MSWLTRHWYQPRRYLTALLALPAGLFALLAALRRTLYRCGVLRREQLPVPVVVIGNINVGGVGKTPLTQALLADFAARGVKVGVISRGYGGSHRQPTEVGRSSTADEVGDEPLLLAAGGAPVVVGRDRVAAARLLLARHPDTELILSDDGLQHYRLARDLEVVVLDGARGLGNGWLLPAGPLRESGRRLLTVDAVVVNGDNRCLDLPPQLPAFSLRLRPGLLQHVAGQQPPCEAAAFAGQRVVAMAGIGHPERFFATLRGLGLSLQRSIGFPDHHAFRADDVPDDADAVIVTSKDAVKLQCVNHARLWFLPVAAEITPDLAGWILSRLKEPHGRKIS